MPRSRAAGLARDTDFNVIVADFGREVTRKLRTGHGSREDHLRGPFERMLSVIADGLGLTITTIGETNLPNLSIRPDYAIDVAGSRVGYVELKKPGYGVPDTWPRPSEHDIAQWRKYQLLPNVLYCDGEQFARYHFGKLQGRVARLEPGLNRAGDRLHAVGTDFARVMTDFLLWEPERPRSLGELVRLVAKLCRLLRDDVAAELVREQAGTPNSRVFTGLATDWRQVLFPNLTDAKFADQYAQTVTFALLLARVEGVDFRGRSISEIAYLLGKKHSLMGRALTVLTDQPDEEHSVALTTMIRVLSVVDWADFPDDSYAMLYEDFLAEYDSRLRRQSGTYYTPAGLVAFLTRFVDDILQARLGRPLGFADRDVIVVDPAMGTGSFLAEVINTVAATIGMEEGDGAVAPHLRELSDRLIGLENQAAPYAVAELRIHSLLRKRHGAEIPARERRFLADTLDDPNTPTLPLGRMYEVLDQSRRGANEVKSSTRVVAVIANPPYIDKVKNTARWIEDPSSNLAAAPSLSAFRKVGNGRLEYVLSNTYVYFWRWATWKVFDAHADQPAGVVAMVCSAGFTAGRGFAGMREYLRRTADEGWIIDLTPEGHQPSMETRFFRGNQQSVCVAVFVRRADPDPETAARVHRITVGGSAAEKEEILQGLSLDDPRFSLCMDDWGAAFTPPERDAWVAMPGMLDLMPWASPGVKPNRTWVYAPEEETLRIRWRSLVNAPRDEKPNVFKETRSTKVSSKITPVSGMCEHSGPIVDESGPCPALRRIAYRSFDRMWVLPDTRLHERPRPSLWLTASSRQIFVNEQHAHPISGGPALVFSSLIPDMHYHSSRGGRVIPLYRDADGITPNVSPGLLDLVTRRLGVNVAPLDLAAYIAAVASHPGYTRRYLEDLKTPGVRIPLTRDAGLWDEAVRVGGEVLWLHTYGERCTDISAGRPHARPKMVVGRPTVQVRIPDTRDGMPDRISYDEPTQTLRIGVGEVAPLAPEVWDYQVSGMRVVKHWFDYRKKRPAGKRTSPLDDMVAQTWTPTMTTELLELLNVLGRCVELEPRQKELLDRIADGPLITVDDLTTAGVLPVPESARRTPTTPREEGLFPAE